MATTTAGSSGIDIPVEEIKTEKLINTMENAIKDKEKKQDIGHKKKKLKDIDQNSIEKQVVELEEVICRASADAAGHNAQRDVHMRVCHGLGHKVTSLKFSEHSSMLNPTGNDCCWDVQWSHGGAPKVMLLSFFNTEPSFFALSSGVSSKASRSSFST